MTLPPESGMAGTLRSGIQLLSTFVNYGAIAWAGVLTQNEAKGIDIMGTTELQGTSKRIRIVLCMLVVLGVTAVVPTSASPPTGRPRPARTSTGPRRLDVRGLDVEDLAEDVGLDVELARATGAIARPPTRRRGRDASFWSRRRRHPARVPALRLLLPIVSELPAERGSERSTCDEVRQSQLPPAVAGGDPGERSTSDTGRLPAGARPPYATAVGARRGRVPPSSRRSSAPPTRSEWTSFALLLPLAALAPRFRVSVGRNHGFHTGPAFIVAGALVLPPALRRRARRRAPPAAGLDDRLPGTSRASTSRTTRSAHSPPGRSPDAIGTASDGARSPSPACSPPPSSSPSTTLLLAIMLRLGAGAHVPRERPLLLDRARDRVRARRARRGRRGLRRVQSLAPARADRAARARPPLALDGRAPARERGAVPDDVRVRADRDDAASTSTARSWR